MTTLVHADATIRRLLREHAQLAVDPDQLPREADLCAAGMTWHAGVNVMLALEGEFEVEFPNRMVRQGALRSIGSIERALRQLIAA